MTATFAFWTVQSAIVDSNISWYKQKGNSTFGTRKRLLTQHTVTHTHTEPQTPVVHCDLFTANPVKDPITTKTL